MRAFVPTRLALLRRQTADELISESLVLLRAISEEGSWRIVSFHLAGIRWWRRRTRRFILPEC
jgi:hypothetical protein